MANNQTTMVYFDIKGSLSITPGDGRSNISFEASRNDLVEMIHELSNALARASPEDKDLLEMVSKVYNRNYERD